MNNRRYVYSVTRGASFGLLCLLVVTLGTLFLQALLRPGEDWVLRVAWLLWASAFGIEVLRAALLRRGGNG